MKIILKQDIYNLGHSGDVKVVRDGYARNYLLPRNMAEIATEGALKAWKDGEEKRNKRIAAENASLQDISKKISEMTLSFARKVSEDGVMYGSVAKSDIVKKFAEKEIAISKDAVRLPATIKAVGNYEVEIVLKQDISAKVKVIVSALSQAAQQTA